MDEYMTFASVAKRVCVYKNACHLHFRSLENQAIFMRNVCISIRSKKRSWQNETAMCKVSLHMSQVAH